ncbi:unnamed protein product [Auanema sp. JU1783]|nr:unnamed protein product [Auanema sp. JU1783]
MNRTLVFRNFSFLPKGRQLSVTSAVNKQDLKKQHWKKDVVYLYQFPRPAVLPNFSPFCLKVETFLRVHNLKHEVIGNYFQRSQNGLLPFVELNGKQVADSQIILWYLQKHFEISHGVNTAEELAVVRTVDRMVSAHTNVLLQHDAVVQNAKTMLSRPVSGLMLPAFVTNYLAKGFSAKAKRRVNGVLGNLSRDDRRESLKQDIAALDAILGDKKFLFGDRMTIADCSTFAHVGIASSLPYRQHITDLLEDDFPRLRNYIQRIRTHYFQDWKDL